MSVVLCTGALVLCLTYTATPPCNAQFAKRGQLLTEAIAAGKHREGTIRPYVTGMTAGRGSARERNASVVRDALSAVIETSGATATSRAPTLQRQGTLPFSLPRA